MLPLVIMIKFPMKFDIKAALVSGANNQWDGGTEKTFHINIS